MNSESYVNALYQVKLDLRSNRARLLESLRYYGGDSSETVSYARVCRKLAKVNSQICAIDIALRNAEHPTSSFAD